MGSYPKCTGEEWGTEEEYLGIFMNDDIVFCVRLAIEARVSQTICKHPTVKVLIMISSMRIKAVDELQPTE